MWQLPQQPLSVKQVIQSSYALFKESLRKLHVALTLFFVLVSAPFIIMDLLNINWVHLVVLSEHRIKYAVFILIYLIATFWIYGTYYHQLNNMMRAQPVTTRHSLLVVLKKLPYLIVAFIIAAVANVIGFLVFVIPGIYLIAVITIYYPIIIIDNTGPIEGFKYAVRLIHHNWWRTAIVLIIPVAISFLLMIATSILIFLIIVIFRPSAAVMDILYVYVQVILGTLFLPMTAAVNSVQIYNLKLRQSAVSSVA
jgi:hypothetical protein